MNYLNACFLGLIGGAIFILLGCAVGPLAACLSYALFSGLMIRNFYRSQP